MRKDLGIFVRGLLMGAADVVPGVSGGTIALIVGIYSRLVGAIGAFDRKFLQLLRERRIGEAAAHVDLRFLAVLLGGIGVAVVSLAKLMTWLILHRPVPTWSFFFGLILASTWIVAKLVGAWRPRELVTGVLGAIFAYWLVGLIPMETPHTPLVLFGSGVVAICAMILPGISGSFVLVILGQYLHVLEAIHQRKLATLAVFAAGCAVGLLSFAKLLRALLAWAYRPTLAFLCGLMAGSLRKIWPWKETLPGQEALKEKYRVQVNVLPDALDGEVMTAIALAVTGAVVVLVIEAIGSRRRAIDEAEHSGTAAGRLSSR